MLHPLALCRMDAFLFKGGKLDADEAGFVRYAEVRVVLAGRRAVRTHGVGYFQARTSPDGTLDQEYYMKILDAAGAVAYGNLKLHKPPPGVIDAAQKFAQRRLEHLSRWTPTRADLEKLRELVNHKAGRAIM